MNLFMLGNVKNVAGVGKYINLPVISVGARNYKKNGEKTFIMKMANYIITFTAIIVLVGAILITEYTTRNRSTIELINGSDYKVLMVLLPVEVGKYRPIPLSIRSDSTIHSSIENGRYVVFYRTDKETGWHEICIIIDKKATYKIRHINQFSSKYLVIGQK
jgi:hypothetical protein